MATLKSKSKKSISVCIRKKGHEHIYKSFSDKETAQLYAKYKEDVMNDMDKFDVPLAKIITLGSAIQIKVEKLVDEQRDKKTISDIQQLYKEFHEWIDLSLSDISYEMMKNKANEMLKSTVRRGGNSDNQSGKLVMQSPVTVRRKFAALSSVVSLLNEMGMDIENRAYRLLGFLNNVIKESV